MAHLLGAARRHLTISWQHADEGGRARIPSLALREVARVCLGSAEQDLAIERAVRVAGHPAASGRQAARMHGLLTPLEASIGAALELGSPVAVRRAAKRLPLPDGIDPCGTLDAGLAMLEIVEDFEGRNLSYDASIGASGQEQGKTQQANIPNHSHLRYADRHVLIVRGAQSSGRPRSTQTIHPE